MAIVFAGFGIGFGYVFPYIYYQYIDNRQYIEYTAPISFDKDEYKSCDTQIATTRLKILIDTPITIKSRLYLMTTANNQFEVVKEYRFDTFFARQDVEQVHNASAILPCNLKEGTYFYRGVSTYSIKGVEKNVSFESKPFRITI